MLNVTFSIVSSQNPNITEVNPTNSDTSSGTIHLGLLEQVHYAGLDKESEQSVD